jgi:hypothetical protein
MSNATRLGRMGVNHQSRVKVVEGRQRVAIWSLLTKRCALGHGFVGKGGLAQFADRWLFPINGDSGWLLMMLFVAGLAGRVSSEAHVRAKGGPLGVVRG